jgi:hypothetical protein
MRPLLIFFAIFLLLSGRPAEKMRPVTSSLGYFPAPVFSGTPFFDENFKYADIILSKTRKFTAVKMRIDLEMHMVQFVSNGVEAELQPGMVKEVSYADTTTDGILFYKFRTGYPASDNRTANHFYIVMAEGSCSLLRLVEKKVTQRRNEITNEVFKDYENAENFFLFTKGGMKRLKKDKDFIMAELADKQVQVNEFVQTNKINFRNVDQLVKLINYYNTL